MKKLFLLLMALLPLMVSADNINEEKAQAIAEKFFASSQMNTKGFRSAPSLQMVWNGEDYVSRSFHAPAFYVFNNMAGDGFVIVSGDERTAAPVLGYSFTGNFDAGNIPENLRIWMNGIRTEINDARVQGGGTIHNSKWETYEYNDRQPVKLLETALWDQRAPYNSKLPMGYVTGCPATAISIIMRFHQWPEKGVGTIPGSNEKIGDVKLGHTYDWGNMPLSYTGASEVQNEQVGILMRDVGAMIRTQYGQGTAGAKPEETLPQVLPVYMRYNAKTIRSLFKSDFSDGEWHALMQKELDENRPILYGGYSSGGGHQFVLDGYAADNYYHVNWGWSGVSNGYYLLTVMNPPEQGAGGSMSQDGFTMRQDAIIGIQPDFDNPGGESFDLIVYKPQMKDKPYGMMSHVKEYTLGEEFQVDLKDFQNKGSRAFAGKLAIAHYAADGSFKGIISKKEIDYARYPQEINDFTEVYIKCQIKQTIEPGDYICGVYKYMNPSDWTPIHNGYENLKNCIDKIVLMEGGDTPDPPKTYDVNVTMNAGGKMLCGDKTYSTSATIKVEEKQSISMTIIPDKGYELVSVIYDGLEVLSELENGDYTTPPITANSTLKITFKKQIVYHNVELTVGEGGRVISNGETYREGTHRLQVQEGEPRSFRIISSEGYELASVLYNGREVLSELENGQYTTPSITSNSTLKITFKKQIVFHNVDLSVGEGGRVISNDETYSEGTHHIQVQEGESRSYRIISSEGYELASVLYNGREVLSELENGHYTTPSITSNSTLKITFKKQIVYHNVDLTIGEGGYAYSNGTRYREGTHSIRVQEGATCSFSITASDGYELESVLFNGENVLSKLENGDYTTPSITSNSTLKITFKKQIVYHNVDLTIGEGGRVISNGETYREGTHRIQVQEGESLSIRIDTEESYRIYAVLYNGKNVSDQIVHHLFQTPPIYDDASISITFDYLTSIENTLNKDLAVFAKEGSVIITGLENNMPVNIYTIGGIRVKSFIATSASVQIPIAENQIYIVRIADKVFKIVL